MKIGIVYLNIEPDPICILKGPFNLHKIQDYILSSVGVDVVIKSKMHHKGINGTYHFLIRDKETQKIKGRIVVHKILEL